MSESSNPNKQQQQTSDQSAENDNREIADNQSRLQDQSDSGPEKAQSRNDPSSSIQAPPQDTLRSSNSNSPYAVGRSDLDPLAASRPGAQSDGMIVGPNHPLFQQQGQQRQPERGPWAGDRFLPPGAVPPGARFDPIGPLGPQPGRAERNWGDEMPMPGFDNENQFAGQMGMPPRHPGFGPGGGMQPFGRGGPGGGMGGMGGSGGFGGGGGMFR